MLKGSKTVFSIVISEKGGSERRESFDQREVTVGRVQGNDLMLPKGNVSKRHCRLENIEGRFVVTDQNSTNGTYVNRRRITQGTVVRQGDRIYIGDFILRLDEDFAAAADSSASGSAADRGGQALNDTGPRSFDVPASDVDVALSSSLGVGAPAPGLSPQPTAPPRPSMSTIGRSKASPTAQQDAIPGGPVSDASSGALVSAVRFLVERASSKLEPRILDHEIDESLVDRVQRLVDEIYAQQQEEAELAPGVPADAVRAAAYAELLEFGPIGPLLDDPSVSEIAASGVGFLTVLRGTQRQSASLPFAAAASIERAVTRLCRQDGEPLGAEEWIVRRHLSSLGFDLDALRGPAAPGGAILRLRRRDPVVSDFEELVRAGVVSRSMATFLRHCVKAHANILVVGARRSGAAEVLSALCDAASPDRVLALHDEEELASTSGSVVAIAASTGSSAEDLLATAAGIPGHRLLVDSMAGERARAMLRAIADGADSTVACIRGGSIERACSRVCADLAMAGGQTARAVADSLIASFDVVVEVARLRDGRSRVLRICELRHGDEFVVAAESIFDFAIERTATGGSIEGSFNASGRSPRMANEIRSRGGRLDSALFQRAPSSE